MRKYLSQLHRRSDRHKKNFALFVSGVVTIIIFSVWSMVNFGGNAELAKKVENNQPVNEVSPLNSMRSNLGSSLEAVKNSLNGIKQGVNDINLELEYREMRDNALESYE